MEIPIPRAILLIILSLSKLCFAQNQCFYPNGQKAADYPCDPDAADSPCCGGDLGAVCLTNGLCRSPNGNTVRGSCTDQDWASTECPQFCLFADTGGTDLISCANVTKTDTSYCCDGYRAFCCDEGVARFDVFPSNPEVHARWDAQATRFVVVQRTTTSSSSSSSSSQASSSSSTSSASSTNTTTTPPPPTGPATGSPTPSTSLVNDDQPQSQPAAPGALSIAAQAGIGVGAGILAIALAVIAVLLFKLRKKKKQETERRREQQTYHQYYGPRALYGGPKPDSDTTAWHHPYPTPAHEVDGWGARFELPATSGKAF